MRVELDQIIGHAVIVNHTEHINVEIVETMIQIIGLKTVKKIIIIMFKLLNYKEIKM